jgi:type IX secretion system PorP/SprF family membrane protein
MRVKSLQDMFILITKKSIMKKYIFLVIFVFVLFFSQRLNAQQDFMFSQYMFNTLSVNPAYAGSSDLVSSTLISRHQWVGLTGAPQTQTFVSHAPLKNRIGAGASAIRDVAGPINNLSFQVNASYFIEINEISRLYFGLMAGFNSINTRLTSVQNVNIDDVAFQQNLNSTRPVFGFGLYFKHPKAYAGFSVPDIAKTDYSGISADWEHKRHFYFIGGYLANMNSVLKFRPTLMLRYVDNAPVSSEITASFIIKDLIWVGLLYRFQDAAGALFCFQLTPNLRIGYSYDYSISSLRGNQSGSHEIMLNYDINYKKANFISPRYF